MKKTICIDFDGVIHGYRKGWHNGAIYDEPVPGAFDTIDRLLDQFNIVIFSAREPRQIIEWLCRRAPERWSYQEVLKGPFFEPMTPTTLGVTRTKLACAVYIDDRAVRFTDWGTAEQQVLLLTHCLATKLPSGEVA